MQVPSLNIHTNQDAENPSVAGGSAADRDQARPVGDLAGDRSESRTGAGKDRSSRSSRLGPGRADLHGVKPAGAVDGTGMFRRSAASAGTRSGSSGSDRQTRPMNVDRTRDGIEPDIAFTGASDSGAVGRLVRERQQCGDSLNNNEMVFAAKGVAPSAAPPPTGTVDGGFNWVAVGATGSGVLDASAHGGNCGTSVANEEALLAQQGRDGGCRGPAGRIGHDDGRQPHGSVGRLG